jgi:hypothetical protein
LEALGGTRTEPPQAGSGRLELARAIVAVDNPLTARVIVNRLWHHHFGAGLVRSPDDFGVMGQRPTHPELLDYLAGQFIRDGWSQKRLIRELVLSRTYRQRAEGDGSSQVAIAADPENRLLWRISPRRLDAEMLRDAVLAVSGELKPCTGGPALAPEFIENVGGLNPTDVNPVSFSLSKFRDDQSSLRGALLIHKARIGSQFGHGSAGFDPAKDVLLRQVLVFNRDVRGFKAGESARLKQITDTHLLVATGAREVSIPFKHLDRLTACQCKEMALASGDRLQLKANGRSVEHRKLVRWTLPVWMYVSVTGVLVYVLLYQPTWLL